MNKTKVIAFVGLFFTLAFTGVQADSLLVTNGKVELDRVEVKEVVAALIASGQISKDQLSVAHANRIARDFVLYKSLAQEAERIGLDSKSEVQKLLEFTRLRTLSNLYLKKYVDELQMPDFEAAAYEEYLMSKDSFKQPETVHAQHILIKFEEDDKAARVKAESIRKKLVSGQQSFAELAEEYSDDATVENNKGDLGFFPRGRMVPEFEKSAFNLKVGEISQLVKTQFGYHIIQLIDKKPEQQIAFAKVKERLIGNLEAKYKQEAYTNKTRETVMTPEFAINEGMLQEIVEEVKASK